LSGRAARVDEMLHGPGARYVHVGTAAAGAAADARRVAEGLAAHGIVPSAWIVNRLLPATGLVQGAERLHGAPPGTREAVERIEADLAAVRARERAEVERLSEELGASSELLRIETRAFDGAAGLDLGKLADAFRTA
jgi:hypothetical protein